ncbi:hypothetical protein CORC01_02850 [Colletotrichum orchidophilum]|uniref:Glucan 1, 4-alpha-glucosidase n=1 Tax=Colletotrichum orchidophilum TaxID=1209926 RepID=A0A1G4BKK3_9PEZI|nr:uncharacterized protein CORC01_02850 [Colletotrichum orchidophilum]OHF01972.1 hypothetical protein CORC01_02850 [Colletotrichum orchidophilum]
MDDPWGSPWASTDNANAPSTSPSKNIIEPPPPAFLSTPSNLNLPSSQSAWLDDDAFGDWASPDPGQATNASPWTWGNEATPIEGLTPSYEPKPRRKSSTPRWPRSRSPSPGLRPPITPNIAPHSASLAQPSPDPWANHVSTYTKDDPEPLADLPHIPDVPPVTHEQSEVGVGLKDTPNAFEKGFTAHETIRTQFAEPLAEPIQEYLQFSETPIFDRFPTTHERVRDTAQSSGSASASSVNGDENDEDDENDENDELPEARHADSPITSIEDNVLPKATQRKASGKVLELVEMYDGIAKRTTDIPERAPSLQRSVSRDLDVGQEDLSGHEFNKDGRIEGNQGLQGSRDTSESTQEEPFDEGSNAAQESVDNGRPTRPDHESFKVDLQNLEHLLPDTSMDASISPEDVPDRVIQDSFASISERKMWYRLSRHESLRKHNAGDDDNYVRVNWANSTLRQDTLKTVRRWIEEDSFGGRPFRGGLARTAGGKSFGWDATTAASPVDLDRVFGRKAKRRAPVHRPTHSIGALPSLSATPILPDTTGGMPALGQGNGNWQDLATFGWSSGPGDIKSTTGTAMQKPRAAGIPLPLAFTGFDNTPKSHASLPAFIKPIAPTPLPAVRATSLEEVDDADADAEDDDWGDMVSPTTAEATDSTSLPKTSWDSFSTNPLADVTSMPPPGGSLTNHPDADALRTGNNKENDSRNKSGVWDFGNVISSPAPASTSSAAAGLPQSQDGPLSPSISTYTFRPASTVKRPPSLSIAATLTGQLDPTQSTNKTGISAGGPVETPRITGRQTPSTAQPNTSNEDCDLVQQFMHGLPDLSYMLK